WQSPGHSAHVGQEVEIQYRWHALYGRRVRCRRGEQRASGPVVYLEAAPGVIIVAAAWILDPAACAGMAFGPSRVTLSALIELHQLLIEHGFRRSFRDDSTIVHEEQNEEPARADVIVYRPAPAQYAVRFGKVAGDEPLGSQHSTRKTGQPLVAGGRRRS